MAFSGGVDSSLVAALAARALGQRARWPSPRSRPRSRPASSTARAPSRRAIGIAHEDDHDRRSSRARATGATTPTAATTARPSSTTRSSSWPAPAATRRCSPARTRDDPATGGPACAQRPSTASSTRCSRPASARTRCARLAARARRPERRTSRRRRASPRACPYGTEVDPAVAAQVDRAELALKALGYPIVRVRHYGELGRVELAGGRPPAAPLAEGSADGRGGRPRRRLRRGRDRRRAVPLGLAQPLHHPPPRPRLSP